MNVAITFYANDALSGVYTTSSENPLIISQEGTDVTCQVVVTDLAGNSTTYTSLPFNIDLYPPTIGSSRIPARERRLVHKRCPHRLVSR